MGFPQFFYNCTAMSRGGRSPCGFGADIRCVTAVLFGQKLQCAAELHESCHFSYGGFGEVYARIGKTFF